jgi:hypothetical protein
MPPCANASLGKPVDPGVDSLSEQATLRAAIVERAYKVWKGSPGRALTTIYWVFLGSVWISISVWQQGLFITKDQICREACVHNVSGLMRIFEVNGERGHLRSCATFIGILQPAL